MNTNKIRLNFALAHSSALAGLIAIPGMIPETIAGPSMRERKVIYYTDINLAQLCKIEASNVVATKNDVLLDHADLPSRSAGMYFEDYTGLSTFIDFETSDSTVGADIHDVGTIMMALSKAKAIELGFKADEDIDDDTIVTVVRGTSADLIADMGEPASFSNNIGKAAVGAFFGSLSEITEGLPVHHTANGLDKGPGALSGSDADFDPLSR